MATSSPASSSRIHSSIFTSCRSVLFLASLTIFIMSHSTASAGVGVDSSQLTWTTTATIVSGSSARGRCEGSIAECMAGEREFDMDTEINRRVLATASSYISYGALQRNTVPCSQRGASYYNCQPGAQANPYTRSCSVLSRCRS